MLMIFNLWRKNMTDYVCIEKQNGLYDVCEQTYYCLIIVSDDLTLDEAKETINKLNAQDAQDAQD